MASPVVDIVLRAKDEASRAINALGKSIGGLNSVARTLAPVAAGLGAIGGAAQLVGIAAFKMANELSDTVERLDRLSETTGASIDQLQILEQTFKNAGLAPETATLALARLAKSIGNNDPLLKQLGITTRDSFAAFKQLSDIFQNSTDKAGKVAVAAKLLGRDMVQSASTVGNLGRELEATGAKMDAAGALFGEYAPAQARKMDKAMDDLDISLAGVKNQIATAVIPAMADLAKVIADSFARNSAAIKAFVADSGYALSVLVVDLEGVGDRLGTYSALWIRRLQLVADVSIAVARGQVSAVGSIVSAGNVELNSMLEAMESRYRDRLSRIAAIRLVPQAGDGESFDPRTGEPQQSAVPATPPRRAGAPVVPSGFTIDAQGNLIAEKENARAKRLREIQSLLRASTADAQAFLKALEAVEGAANAEALRVEVATALIATAGPDLQRQLDALGPLRGPKIALREAGDFAGATGQGTVAGLKPRGGKLPDLAPPIDEAQIKAWQEQVRAGADGLEAIILATQRVKDGWIAAVEQMTSAATVLDAGFQAVFSGLESGISNVFSRLTDRMQTLRGAMATIFKSIASQALRELARIAAAALFKFVVKLLLGISSGGGSFVSDGISGSVLAGARRVGPGVASISRNISPTVNINTAALAKAVGNAVADAMGGRRDGVPLDQRTFVINAIDAHDIVASLLLPGGGMRRANDRLSLAGAY